MPEGYFFRIANSNDIESLYSVMVSTNYLSAIYSGLEKKGVLKALNSDLFDESKKITVVVAESNGKVIAYSIFGPYAMYRKKGFPEEKGNYAYSKGTGVHADYRGKGLGTIIRLKSDRIAEQQGYAGMYTDVASTNIASIRVQEKAGFKWVCVVEDERRKKGVFSIIFKKTFSKLKNKKYAAGGI